MRIVERPHAAVSILAVAAAVWGLVALSRYGVPCDSPALFYAGDRTLFALIHPHAESALDLLGSEPQGFHSEFGRFPSTDDAIHYPVLPGLFCALTNAVFHARLGWLNAIDGHQMGLVLLHAIALLAYGRYASRVLGRLAGVFSTLLLATFPCALGHSFNNAKDWPCAQFYGIAILAAGAGVIERRGIHLVAAGVWWGLCLSCKFNGVFVPVAVAAWTPVAYLELYCRQRRLTVGVVGGYLLAPYLGVALFVWAWPWLHHGDVREWWGNLSEYVRFMVQYGVTDRATWTTYPLRCVAYMTPPVVLALALVYGLTGSRGSSLDTARWALLLVWTAVPVVRVSMPRSSFYDANRHFIEYVPGLCAMAGAGASRLTISTRGWLGRLRASSAVCRAVATASAVALGASVVWPVAEYHPFETTYFNVFAGGLGGAQRRGLLHFEPADQRANGTEGDYWWTSLRDAANRLRKFRETARGVGFCATSSWFVEVNWRGLPSPSIVDVDDAALVYVAPRENWCSWKNIHAFESARPIVERVVRGGGLIYELLGPKDGQVHTQVSPLTRYDRPPP